MQACVIHTLLYSLLFRTEWEKAQVYYICSCAQDTYPADCSLALDRVGEGAGILYMYTSIFTCARYIPGGVYSPLLDRVGDGANVVRGDVGLKPRELASTAFLGGVPCLRCVRTSVTCISYACMCKHQFESVRACIGGFLVRRMGLDVCVCIHACIHMGLYFV
jgi:hypothetical protein